MVSFNSLTVWWLTALTAIAREGENGLLLLRDGIASGNSSSPMSTGGFKAQSTTPSNWTITANATSSHAASGTLGTSSTSAEDPVLSCDSEWATYSRSSILAYKPVSESTYTQVVISTQTLYQTTYTCSSTCGNVCYADVTTTASSTLSSTDTITSTSTQWATYTGPKPSCTVLDASCTSIWRAWSASTSVWNTWYNNMEPDDEEPPWPYATPGCSKDCDQTNCYIQGSGKLQIYYWPEPTSVARDMCTDFPSRGYTNPCPLGDCTATPYTEVTTKGSAVIDGNTFYEGNVYLSVPAASVTNNCGSTVGSVRSNFFVTLASSDIYTARNDKLGTYAIDYADFNTPVPWSAYRGALSDCLTGMNIQMGPWCTRSVVFQDQFHPVIQLPYAMQNIDPAWAGCRPIDALLDPPIALSSAKLFPSAGVTTLPTSSVDSPAINTPAKPASELGAIPTSTEPANPGIASGGGGGGGASKQQPVPTKAPVVQSNPTAPIILTTIGPTTIAVDPTSNVVVDPGTTITNGASASTISGTVISVGKEAITVSSPAKTSIIPIVNLGSPISINAGDQSLTLNAAGNLAVPTATLRKEDSPMKLDGLVYIFDPTSDSLTIMDPASGSIKVIPYNSAPQPQAITAGEQVITIKPSGVLVLGSGKTLHAGDPAVTISGTTFLAGSAGVTIADENGHTSVVGWTGNNAATGQAENAEATGTQIPSTQLQDAVGSGTAAPTSSKKGTASSLIVMTKMAILILSITLLNAIQ